MSDSKIFIPFPLVVDDGFTATGVYVTASEVRDVLTSSHLHCGWEVSRGGQAEPCGKEAVAIRWDEQHGVLGEVCKAHACRVLVPLSFIAEVAGANRGSEG